MSHEVDASAGGLDGQQASASLRELLRQRFGESFEVPDDVPGLEALVRIAGWTTHRNWSERALPEELLRLLAACALSAPSKSYLLQADIVHVKAPEQRRAVEALAPSMPWMRQAPALLVFCGNGRRFRRIFESAGQSFSNEHLDGVFNPAIDAALVMMNFMQAACAAGLAACPISVLRDQAAELARILAMPEHVFPVAGLCVGYPVHTHSVNPRLSLSATLITDRYPADGEHAGVDAALQEFDARYVAMREARLAAMPPGNTSGGNTSGGDKTTGDTSTKAKPKPMTWTEEKRRQYAKAQRADWGAFLRARGFSTD